MAPASSPATGVHSEMRLLKRHRIFFIALIVLSVLFIGIYVASEVYRRMDFQPNFVSRKGQLISTEERIVEKHADYSIFEIRLDNEIGVRVRGLMRVPSSTKGPCPALVMLGGLRTGKRVLDYIENTKGLVLLALDYTYEDKKSNLHWWEFLAKIPDMRRAIMNTAPAVMLSIDYLTKRTDVDQGKIILVGGSLGALFAPSIAAADPRISAVAVLFGAGDLQSLFYANINMPAPVAHLASWAAAILTSPIEPLKYVDRISPRPVFMLNGTGDPRMPLRCSQLLHEKARQPKTIRWIPAGHVNVWSKEFHKLVGQELIAWLVEINMIPPGSVETSSSGQRR